MKTKVSIIKNIESDNNYIEEAAKIIKEGGLVAFPTETVYGLGADALNPEAVKKIFIAKGRPQDNPLIIHVCSKDIRHLVSEVPDIAQKLIDKFWPGPLTVILKKKDIVPDVTSASLSSIGIRMPKNEIALKLIKISGTPIAAPSANISGRPSPTDIQRCIQDLDGRVDYIIGGEKCRVGVESTIVDCTVYPPVVLRPGGITIEMLREIDKDIYIDKAIMEKPKENLKPKAPGMKYKHYAPKAAVKIVQGDNKKKVDKINQMIHYYSERGLKAGVLATKENIDKYDCKDIINLGSGVNLAEAAQNLFEALRSFDDIGVDIILAEGLSEEGIGIAIMNRLKKSAGYDIITV